MRRYYNLVLAVFWLIIAILLLAPEDAIAPKLARNLGGPLRLPAGIFAIVLTLYNLVRWWSYRALSRRRSTTVQNPLAPRRDPEAAEYERNPEFDFLGGPREPGEDSDDRGARNGAAH